jgi:phenylalanine-4-hydroxylase
MYFTDFQEGSLYSIFDAIEIMILERMQDYQSNELIDRLPKHLKQFIKPQNYDDYTSIDQAVWRYALRRLVRYLSKVAHSSYL